MTPVRSERPISFFRRMLRPPASLWDQYSLTSSLLRPASGEARYSSRPRPERFRLALEEAGGMFTVFGQFLSGRADLLPSAYLSQLRVLRTGRKARTPPESLAELRERVFEIELLRTAPCSETYAATFQDRPVVLEIHPREEGYFPENARRELARQLRLLRDTPESPVAAPLVLEQFREWIGLHSDAERRRSLLRNLQEAPTSCISRFPRLVPELQSARCVAYERLEGTPLPDALALREQSARAMDLWAEGLMEQSLLLSVVDGEAFPDSYLLLRDGGVGFRSLPALAPVPVEWHYELLQYATSAATGNSHRAIQMLSRICSSQNAYATEQLLLERLSALQPELNVRRTSMETVELLENYWRALAQTSLRPPLFLHLFHRNLSILSQSGTPAAPGSDPAGEALWPVLGRILQFRLGEMFSTEKGREWLVSSGLLLMGAARQMAATLEQVRDDDLALVVEEEQTEPREERQNRRVASGIRAAICLVLFLFSIELARRSTGPLQLLGTVGATVSGIALSILLARIE